MIRPSLVLGAMLGCLAIGFVATVQSHAKASAADIDRLKRELADAEKRLTNAQKETARWQDNYDDVRRRQRDLPKQIDDLKKRQGQLQTQVSDAEKTIAQAKSALTTAKSAADAKRPATKSAQDTLDAARKVVADIKAKLTAQFEASPDWQSAKTATDAAQTQYDTAAAACLDRLGKTAEFQAILLNAQTTEQRVKELRNAPGGSPELPAASQAWIDAKNKLEVAKNDALAADPATSSAKTTLVQAQAAQKALRARFEADLPNKPEMIPAMDDQRKCEQTLGSATADLRKAEADVTTAQNNVKKKEDLLAHGKTDLKNFEKDLKTRQDDYKNIDSDLRDTDRRLRQARDDEDRARRDRDDAAKRLRDAQR